MYFPRMTPAAGGQFSDAAAATDPRQDTKGCWSDLVGPVVTLLFSLGQEAAGAA